MTDFNIPPAAWHADTCKKALNADMEPLDRMELLNCCDPWTEYATLAVMKDRQMIADELEKAHKKHGIPWMIVSGPREGWRGRDLPQEEVIALIRALRAAAVDPLVGA